MTWTKLDDSLLEHPAIIGLSDRARWLWVAGLVYCGRNLTDGQLTPRDLRTLAPMIGFGAKKMRAATAELLESGLWIESENGRIDVRNYLRWQPSASQVEAQREAWAERQRRYRAGETDVRHGVTNGVSHRTPTRPDPKAGSSEVGPKEERRPLDVESLPFEIELLGLRLLDLCRTSFDDGTEKVLRSYMRRLTPAAVAKVIETTAKQPIALRSRYANGALRREVEETSR